MFILGLERPGKYAPILEEAVLVQVFGRSLMWRVAGQCRMANSFSSRRTLLVG